MSTSTASIDRHFLLYDEDGHRFEDPSSDDIRFVVGTLTSDGGPGFAVLQESNFDPDDYTQVAGGLDPAWGIARYTVERRVYARPVDSGTYDAGGYEHYVAGRVEGDRARPARIETNGYHVDATENEVLTADDAVEIMSAFVTSRDLSERFIWRSIKETVLEIIQETAEKRGAQPQP